MLPDTKTRLRDFREESTLYLVLGKNEVEDILDTLEAIATHHYGTLGRMQLSMFSARLASGYMDRWESSFRYGTGLQLRDPGHILSRGTRAILKKSIHGRNYYATYDRAHIEDIEELIGSLAGAFSKDLRDVMRGEGPKPKMEAIPDKYNQATGMRLEDGILSCRAESKRSYLKP